MFLQPGIALQKKQFLPPLCREMGFLRAIALLLFCVASTLLMGPHQGPRGRDKGQISNHFGEGSRSLSHFTSAVCVQIPAVTRVPTDCCRCWPSECHSCGSPGSRQEGGWELGEF